MSETIHSTGGSEKTTREEPKAQLWLFGLVLAVLASTGLILWVSQATWKRVDELQLEFKGLRAENFYFGVRLQNSIRQLNDTLLRYLLDGEDEDGKRFAKESEELKHWLDQYRTNSPPSLEHDFAEEIATAYAGYLAETQRILRKEPALIPKIIKGGNYMFPENYQQVQAESEALLARCNSFITEQRASFAAFLVNSNATLETFQQLLRIFIGLVLILAAVLVLLVYRGMIAPLRHQLIESHATIARQEKLASLGSLAAGVAHEIRNPLTAIRFRLFSLQRAIPGSESESEDVTVIASELDRLERIVQDFLRFARPSEPELVSVPAQRLLQEVSNLLQPQLARNQIELKLEESDPLWVRADTQQIKQVMINLIQNAAESIKQHGSITLRVRPERAPSRHRNGLAVLEVSDTGKGIPRELEKRLFDPFFTTKEGGTGLGLPIAARIVEKHGGVIRYRTNSDGGATFSVVLPHVEEHEANHFVDRG